MLVMKSVFVYVQPAVASKMFRLSFSGLFVSCDVVRSQRLKLPCLLTKRHCQLASPVEMWSSKHVSTGI